LVRIARTTLRVIMLIIQLCLTLVSIMGTLSSILITSSPYNIYIDTPIVNMDNSSLSVTVPFGLNNTGLYDFTNVSLNVKAEFSNASIQPTPVLINMGSSSISNIPAGNNFYDSTAFSATNIDITPVTSISSIVNWEVKLLLTIISFYSLNLISFEIILNVTLGG